MAGSSGAAAGLPSRPLPPGRERPPLVIGHRGLPRRFPDNSLAGVEAALSVGADGVEVDVRRCAEGVWVCHHDRSRAGRRVDRWDLAELEREGVPTFDEVARAVPAERWLYVEVKPLAAAALRAGLAALRGTLDGRLPRTRMISSSLDVLDAVGMALPGVARSWVIDRPPRRRPPEGIDLSPHHRLVEELLALCIPLHPWAPDARTRIASLARLGVASITTNRPDVALEVVRG